VAKISGELNMNSNKIVNVTTPTAAQDAATKSYVDGATTNMATTSSVSTAITTALGSSGTHDNRPTVQRDDALNDTHYLTYISSSDVPSNGLSKRALLRCDANGPKYNPSTNTLTATTFSGSLSGNASSADDAGKAGYVVNGILNGGWRLYCNGDTGYIGIGTTAPAYPVDIIAANKNVTTDNTSFWWGHGSSGFGINQYNINGTPVAMRINGSIWIESTTQWVGFWATSDRRIKKNINYNISSECLNIFRKLKCTNYSYVDEREHKTNVYGYIAQDVSTVLPYAVTTQTGFIPNLYSLAKISRENGFVKITCSEQKPYIFHSLHDKDGTVFVTDKNEPASDKDGGRHFKVKLFDISMNEFIVKIKQIVDNGVFTIENDETSVKLTYTEYFVFGQEVDDYKILNNEAITMVATAALQEVDRQQQADKVRIAELETTVAQQQSLINEILERLKNAKI
jgi:hypothetical protein